MATFFSQIQHTYAPICTEDSDKEDLDAATFLAATRESLALLGNVKCTVIVRWEISAICWI